VGHDGVNAPRMSHAVPPSQDTEKHARRDTDVDEPSEASENEEPDDPTEVDAAEAAHATTRLAQSGLPGLARYQDAVSSIELRNRRAVIVEQTRALKTEARRRCRPNSPGGRGRTGRGRTGDGR
jgi:hypothetical protein